MERIKNFWRAFKDVAIIFSFVVNFVLVAALLVVSVPALKGALALKSGMVEPLLDGGNSSRRAARTVLPCRFSIFLCLRVWSPAATVTIRDL